MQVSPLRYASVEMTNLWWLLRKERFAHTREYPTQTTPANKFAGTPVHRKKRDEWAPRSMASRNDEVLVTVEADNFVRSI